MVARTSRPQPVSGRRPVSHTRSTSRTFAAFPSLNELRSAYEGGYGPSNREFDPARDLVGRRINVPELDGLDFRRPVVSYTLDSGAEVILVPVSDFAACRRAFETNREAVRLREPKRIARQWKLPR